MDAPGCRVGRHRHHSRLIPGSPGGDRPRQHPGPVPPARHSSAPPPRCNRRPVRCPDAPTQGPARLQPDPPHPTCPRPLRRAVPRPRTRGGNRPSLGAGSHPKARSQPRERRGGRSGSPPRTHARGHPSGPILPDRPHLASFRAPNARVRPRPPPPQTRSNAPAPSGRSPRPSP